MAVLRLKARLRSWEGWGWKWKMRILKYSQVPGTFESLYIMLALFFPIVCHKTLLYHGSSCIDSTEVKCTDLITLWKTNPELSFWIPGQTPWAPDPLERAGTTIVAWNYWLNVSISQNKHLHLLNHQNITRTLVTATFGWNQKATSACANLLQKQMPAVKIRSWERNPILNPHHSCQSDNVAMHTACVIWSR